MNRHQFIKPDEETLTKIEESFCFKLGQVFKINNDGKYVIIIDTYEDVKDYDSKFIRHVGLSRCNRYGSPFPFDNKGPTGIGTSHCLKQDIIDGCRYTGIVSPVDVKAYFKKLRLTNE